MDTFKKYERQDGEFECPYTEKRIDYQGRPTNLVTTEWCESFNLGKGCKFKNECKNYLNAKNKVENNESK